MKRKHVAKMVSAVLVTTMLMGLAGCGSSGTKDVTQSGSSSSTGDEGIASDSPYAGKGYDLSEKKTVVMYVLGDTPEDMDEVRQMQERDRRLSEELARQAAEEEAQKEAQKEARKEAQKEASAKKQKEKKS